LSEGNKKDADGGLDDYAAIRKAASDGLANYNGKQPGEKPVSLDPSGLS
jgi:hypothetical protein